MKMNHTFVLYALTIGLAGYAALQHLAQQDLRLMLQGMPNRTVTPSATPDITAMQSAIAELRNEVAALREQLEQLDAGGVANSSTPMSQPQRGNAAGPTVSSAYADSRLNTPEAFDARAQSQLMMEYGEFINSLGLSAEGRRRLYNIMKPVVLRRLEQQRRMATGDFSGNEIPIDTTTDMATELAKYLSREEMAVFDDFEADRPNRDAERAVRAEMYALEMRVPGLTAASQELVARAIMAVNTDENIFVENAGAGADAVIAEQTRRIEMLLEGNLVEEQLLIAKEFLETRRKLAQAYNE